MALKVSNKNRKKNPFKAVEGYKVRKMWHKPSMVEFNYSSGK